MRTPVLAALLLALPLLWSGCSAGPPPVAEPPLYQAAVGTDAPVGVLDRTRVLVAYHRSRYWNDRMAPLLAEHRAATAANDQARVRAAVREGEARQACAHRQLLGREPLGHVADDLRPDIEALARSAGVRGVYLKGQAPPDAKAIDLTAQLEDRLRIAARTGANP